MTEKGDINDSVISLYMTKTSGVCLFCCSFLNTKHEKLKNCMKCPKMSYAPKELFNIVEKIGFKFVRQKLTNYVWVSGFILVSFVRVNELPLHCLVTHYIMQLVPVLYGIYLHIGK